MVWIERVLFLVTMLLCSLYPALYPHNKYKLSCLHFLTSSASSVTAFLSSTSWHLITLLLLYHTIAGTKSLAPACSDSIRFLKFLQPLCWSGPWRKTGLWRGGQKKKGGSRKESSKPFRNGGGAGEGSSYEYAFICSRKELYCNQDAEKCLLLTGPSEKRLSSLEWSL